jgi:hypothetical protein
MDGQQARDIWQQLHAAIKQIHNKNASSLSFEELYRLNSPSAQMIV